MAKSSTIPGIEVTAAESPGGKAPQSQPCLIAQSLSVIGDRWTLLILRDLMAGLHRYSDILGNCAGMSPNVLSDRLKRLEGAGLVNREYFRELPPRVEYTLTEKGWAVRPILLSLIEWGREHLTPFDPQSARTDVPADFAVRVVPTFSFLPERAGDLAASMVIEISDCSDCNTWTLEIRDGRIHPRRRAAESADLRLVTTTPGFVAFIRGEVPAEECGTLHGDPATARAIQACFLSH